MNKAYVKKIAEFILGTNKGKEFEKYVKEFDPSKPKFKNDELKFFESLEKAEKKENEIKDARQNFRNEDYFIRHFSYAFFGGKEDVPMPKETEPAFLLMDDFIKKMGSWVHKLFTDVPMFMDSSVPFHDTYNDFIKNHNVNINVKEMSSALDDLIEAKEYLNDTFKAYYKCMFSSIASKVFKNERVPKLHKDYENVMRCLLKTKVNEKKLTNEEAKGLLNGGMDKKELATFLKRTERLIKTSYERYDAAKEEAEANQELNKPNKEPIVIDENEVNKGVTVGKNDNTETAPIINNDITFDENEIRNDVSKKLIDDLTVDEYIKEIDNIGPLNLEDLEDNIEINK